MPQENSFKTGKEDKHRGGGEVCEIKTLRLKLSFL